MAQPCGCCFVTCRASVGIRDAGAGRTLGCAPPTFDTSGGAPGNLDV